MGVSRRYISTSSFDDVLVIGFLLFFPLRALSRVAHIIPAECSLEDNDPQKGNEDNDIKRTE